MAKKLTKEWIKQIITKKWLVEFNRKPLDKHRLFGFILAYNDEFTLIQEFDRNLFRLDGYVVFQNESVKDCWVYDDPDYFLSEVIRFERLRPKSVRQISIDSWAKVLETASKLFPVVVIEQESIDKDVCYVGRLAELNKNGFVLFHIDPEAEWEKIWKYKYKDLTMVKFGGRYETVLAAVNSKRDTQNSK